MFRRFGSRVTVVEMGPRVVAREDEDVSLEIQDFLRGEGIELRLDAECITVQKDAEGLSVGLNCKAGPPREHGTHLLIAVGRVPETVDLGRVAAGITTEKRGYIEVDEVLEPPVDECGARRLQRQGAFTDTAKNDTRSSPQPALDVGGKHHDRLPATRSTPTRCSGGRHE